MTTKKWSERTNHKTPLMTYLRHQCSLGDSTTISIQLLSFTNKPLFFSKNEHIQTLRDLLSVLLYFWWVLWGPESISVAFAPSAGLSLGPPVLPSLCEGRAFHTWKWDGTVPEWSCMCEHWTSPAVPERFNLPETYVWMRLNFLNLCLILLIHARLFKIKLL